MEKQNSNDSVFNRGVQDYLSLGYLYLLVLGIVTDTIYYSFLGINILSYSTITDVLLSPVVYLTKSLAFPIFIFLIPAFGYGIVRFLYNKHQKNREKNWYRENHNVEELDEKYSRSALRKGLLTLTAVMVFSAYFGYGIGGGMKRQDQIIKKGVFTTNRVLTFSDGEVKEVKLIGHNSSYMFYAEKDSMFITVAPVQGNIKKIEKIKK